LSENGESKAFEISSREGKEIGVNKIVFGKVKQEIIYMNSGNYDIQQRSISYENISTSIKKKIVPNQNIPKTYLQV
jgi:hypothetical protein